MRASGISEYYNLNCLMDSGCRRRFVMLEPGEREAANPRTREPVCCARTTRNCCFHRSSRDANVVRTRCGPILPRAAMAENGDGADENDAHGVVKSLRREQGGRASGRSRVGEAAVGAGDGDPARRVLRRVPVRDREDLGHRDALSGPRPVGAACARTAARRARRRCGSRRSRGRSPARRARRSSPSVRAREAWPHIVQCEVAKEKSRRCARKRRGYNPCFIATRRRRSSHPWSFLTKSRRE